MKDSKNQRFKNGTKAVKQVFKAMPTGKQFFGWELKKGCVELYPELSGMYVDTLLRALRKNFHGDYVLLSKPDSLYKKISEQVIQSEQIEIRRPELKKYANLKQQSFNFEGGD